MAETVILPGRIVTLEPLGLEHVPALAAAAGESRDTYAYTEVPDGVAETDDYVRCALAGRDEGDMLPFAIVLRAGRRVVGSTRFTRMQTWQWPAGSSLQRPPGVPDVVDIGHTWLAASVQRTGVNTECKLLMLEHAFQTWRVHRVGFTTDARNDRSRRAIERLGAALDGVRRAERPAHDATIRDTATYSIIAAEWPGVCERLRGLLRAPSEA